LVIALAMITSDKLGDSTSGRVLPHEDPPIQAFLTMNNTAWQNARKKAAEIYEDVLNRPCPTGFQTLHVHDLRHPAVDGCALQV
jgi:hypothetical protein